MSRNKQGKFEKIRESSAITFSGLILLSLGTGALSLLMATAGYGMPMMWAYLSTPALLALNLLPAVLLIVGLYFATGRVWISFLAPSLLVLVASCANFLKILLRGDPLIAEDIAHTVEAGKALGGFELGLSWRIVLCAVYLVLGAVFAVVFLRYRPRGWKIRLLPAVAALAALIGVGVPVYKSDSIYEAVVSGYEFVWPNSTEQYIARGFVFPFLHSVKNAFSVPPEDYSVAETKEILEEYVYDDIPEEQQINVISVMLEAFCDLSEYESLVFETDIYARWHELQNEAISGRLVTNIFAGGTIDTERLFLMGETMLRPINNKTQSYLYYLREQGYYTEGFHPGDRWYYDRENVHRDIGFEKYYFLDDFTDATQSDEYFFAKVLELYDARDKSVPYFNHSLTIQNHGAYFADQNYGEGIISPEGLTTPTYNILSNYLAGIYDTNERIFNFLEQLRHDTEPVVVVLYGDHKPWLGNYESVYRELEISLDTKTEEGFYNMYATPYIIWANEAAKKALGDDFSGDGGDFSPCFLMNRLFALCKWSGDDYMKLSNDVFERVSVINTPEGLYVEDGVLTDQLLEQARELLRKLSYAAYYRRSAF